MQVVRNAFVPRLAQQRSLRRKLIEIHLAHRLERALTKQQILALYLNVIYLGQRRLRRRGRQPRSLRQERGPAHRGRGRHPRGAGARARRSTRPGAIPDRALARRNLVLTVMAREHYLSDTLAQRVRRATPLRLLRRARRPREDRSFALDPVRAVVDSVLGDDQLGDLVVYTTLDARAQRAAERRGARGRRTRSTAQPAGRRGARAPGATRCRARSWRSTRATASSARWSARGATCPAASTARSSPGGSRAPRSSRSCTRRRSPRGMTPAAVIMDAPIEITEQRPDLAPGELRRDSTPAASRSAARSCARPTPPPCGWASRWASGGWRRSPAAPGSAARSPRCRPWRSARAR